jgi:hypothetical protein
VLAPARHIVRLVLRALLVVFAALAGFSLALLLWLRREQRDWGNHPADSRRALPGDDLVPDAGIQDTRSLVINAPPAAVWPWLLQLGYGRGGWYSYDRMDMKGRSADAIRPEFQQLNEGDVVPTYPGGGFVVRVLEPLRALVLYLDSDLVRRQAEDAARREGRDGAPDEPLTTGLRAAGTMGDLAMPSFAASWSMVLEPERAGAATRLIERFRVQAPATGLPSRLGMPVMGLGVFAMTRKHMLGLRDRAERVTGPGQPGEGPVTPRGRGAVANPEPSSAPSTTADPHRLEDG